METTMRGLNGKIVIVAGDGDGGKIGRATCNRFGATGGKIAVPDIAVGTTETTVIAISAGDALLTSSIVTPPIVMRYSTAVAAVAYDRNAMGIAINSADGVFLGCPRH
jgi:hypothetical protein